jgi:hypothetical protein
LIERIQDLQRLGLSLSLLLETADRKALQKLATILNNNQYALYQELRAKKKQDKDKIPERPFRICLLKGRS